MVRRGLVFGLIAITVLGLIGNVMAGTEDQVDQPLVNTMFFETDLREALSEISLQTGVNIIPDQTVAGVVTADLQDVPLEQALRIVLIGGGYTFRRIDGYYLVGLPDPRSTTFGNLVDTEIVKLKHSTVSNIMAVIPSFLEQYIKGDGEDDLLCVTAPPRELERILDFIERLDKPPKQIEVKVVVTEVSRELVKELGNSLLQLSVNKGQQFNDQWEASLEHMGGLLTVDTDIYGQLLTRLRILEEQEKAEIHADPRVVVADGHTAELAIGDERIFVVESGEGTNTTTEEVEVGISLKVTADVVGDDDVILKLAPEISHFVGEAKPDLVIKRNSVSTTVRLRNGQTAALAGMTVRDTTDYSRKVPFFGDIPLIRWLFRNDVKREADKELLIFVTPVIQ